MGRITFKIAIYHKTTKWFCGSHITDREEIRYLNVPPNSSEFEDFFYENKFLVLDYMINKLVKELPMNIQIKGAVFENNKMVEQICIKRSSHGDKFQLLDGSGKLIEERDLNDNLERATNKNDTTVSRQNHKIRESKTKNESSKISKVPGKASKKSLVLDMFENIGDTMDLNNVLVGSGFDLRNFKAFISIMKNPKKTKPEDIQVFKIEGDSVIWME